MDACGKAVITRAMNPLDGLTSPRETRHRVTGETPMMRANSASDSMPLARRSSSSFSRSRTMTGPVATVELLCMWATLAEMSTHATAIAIAELHGWQLTPDQVTFRGCKVIARVQFLSYHCRVTKIMTWPDLLREMAGDAEQAQIAERLGKARSTISRWLSGESKPDSTTIQKVSAAYGHDPQQALIELGILRDPATAPKKRARSNIREFTDLELAREIVRRIESRESVTLSSPLDGYPPDADTNVVPIRQDRFAAEDLDAVAKAEKTVIDVPEFDD